MAKGQKKSNRETRKPKQAKAKPAPASQAFAGVLERSGAKPAAGKKPGRR